MEVVKRHAPDRAHGAVDSPDDLVHRAPEGSVLADFAARGLTKPAVPPPTTGGGTTEQPSAKVGPLAHPVTKITISGSVPIESWHELFRCFVKPSADLKPKKLKLGVDFELAFDDDQSLSPESPAIRGMKEAARQLGLEIDVADSK